jgi:hypothetical protein
VPAHKPSSLKLSDWLKDSRARGKSIRNLPLTNASEKANSVWNVIQSVHTQIAVC